MNTVYWIHLVFSKHCDFLKRGYLYSDCAFSRSRHPFEIKLLEEFWQANKILQNQCDRVTTSPTPSIPNVTEGPENLNNESYNRPSYILAASSGNKSKISTNFSFAQRGS